MDEIRVLIVDDEVELVSALEERLNLRGVDAAGVASGAQALAYLDESPCDVVLLDMKMPEMGGLEVMNLIKEKRPSLPVILLTGRGSENDARKGTEAGAFDYLVKPVQIDNLIRALLAATAEQP